MRSVNHVSRDLRQIAGEPPFFLEATTKWRAGEVLARFSHEPPADIAPPQRAERQRQIGCSRTERSAEGVECFNTTCTFPTPGPGGVWGGRKRPARRARHIRAHL